MDTHANSYDIAYLSNLPGFVAMATADELDLMNMVATATATMILLHLDIQEGVGRELPEGNPLEEKVE